MEDDITLADYGIDNGSNIMLVMRLYGGGNSQDIDHVEIARYHSTTPRPTTPTFKLFVIAFERKTYTIVINGNIEVS